MSSPYVGEIRMFAGNFAPVGWNFCDGSLLSIAEFSTLFNLIGTTYGGDGIQTFALPDLRGRIPVHQGNGFVIGQLSGAETVTLIGNQIPIHTHVPLGQGTKSTQAGPGNNLWATTSGNEYTANTAPGTNMNTAAIGNAGNSQPHNNIMPYLAVNFIISFFGIFPSQN